jgi:hypothetical protein
VIPDRAAGSGLSKALERATFAEVSRRIAATLMFRGIVPILSVKIRTSSVERRLTVPD